MIIIVDATQDNVYYKLRRIRLACISMDKPRANFCRPPSSILTIQILAEDIWHAMPGTSRRLPRNCSVETVVQHSIVSAVRQIEHGLTDLFSIIIMFERHWEGNQKRLSVLSHWLVEHYEQLKGWKRSSEQFDPQSPFKHW